MDGKMIEETRTTHEGENIESRSATPDNTETMESFLEKYEVGEIHRGDRKSVV